MTVERRDANVLFVAFTAPAPAESRAECPLRRCCTCAHWLPETRTCLLGARCDAPLPATDEDDWCGCWEPRSLRVVGGAGTEQFASRRTVVTRPLWPRR